MPIYKEWQHGEHARGAIWKITEPEDFFTQATGLSSDKKTSRRRTEHLAGRFLLQQLVPGLDLQQIEISHLGKPFLPGNPLHFSISHSYPFIGAAIDRDKEVGIDVQTLTDKIHRLQYKFLSDEEQLICDNSTGRITLAWAAKEAAFKRYGLGAVDFIRHMPIREMTVAEQVASMKMEFLRENEPLPISLHGGIEDDFAWSVTL
ncbi:MAG: 4'-phosphopantetheinyl transferase superfamily protein [Sphingobacteriales bacterium]|nr:MAG: 4'-phosphopantetheinyl transferase superfamily protein [Sphingobacteriales bacterium]